MRRLHAKVNLIPVIAKADTMTDEEIAAFKARVSMTHEMSQKDFCLMPLFLCQILADIAHHNIHIYEAPTYENEDEEAIAEAEEIAVGIHLSDLCQAARHFFRAKSHSLSSDPTK